MIPENTTQNKAAFMALYWGQEVIASDKHTAHGLKPLPVCGAIMKEIDRYRHCYLLLKPLSSISDEDAIEVVEILKMYGARCGSMRDPKKYIMSIIDTPSGITLELSQIADYLRSRGYALPFRGLSVDDLIEYGWIKLREVEK